MTLTIENLEAGYVGPPVLHDISLDVKPGEIAAVIGPNGAGKSTMVRCITGLLKPMSGNITFEGKNLTGRSAWEVIRQGIAMVPERKGIFPRQSVNENLLVGAHSFNGTRDEVAARIEKVLKQFPILRERFHSAAGTLSGGEQQMLAIGMAMMVEPRLLILDEPSLGLAPRLANQIFDIVRQLCEGGTTILIVEQMVGPVLRLADRACLIELGRVRLHGDAAELRESPEIAEIYLGGRQK